MVIRALLLITALLISLFSGPNQAESFSRGQIKAVYLYNFASFVRWNSDSFSAHPDEFHFCSYQPNHAVVSALAEIIKGEQVNERQLILRILEKNSPPENCQMLFVNRSDTKPRDIVREQLLTVSDQPDFALSGGMIELYLDNNRIRPRVHLGQLSRAGLSASSLLLSISDRITDSEMEPGR